MVSIIIVNYNGRKHLARCLEALRRQTYQDFEVIVVDNGSSDGSVAFLAEHFPEVRTIPLAGNLGFTGGNIAGYASSTGELIALLNNDTEVSEHWLAALVSAMEGDPQIGICSSRIIVTATGLVDSVGGMFTTAGSGFKRGEGESPERFSEPCEVAGACAAAALYRRAMLDDIGFLDNDFFLNHEDTDLDFRALLAGWRSVYVPEATVLHDVSATLGAMSDLTVYYFSRNNPLVWVKNMPCSLMLRFFHHRVLYECAALFYYCVVGRRWKAYLLGKFAALRLLPKMLRKRALIQSKRRITTADLRSRLVLIPQYLAKRRTAVKGKRS